MFKTVLLLAAALLFAGCSGKTKQELYSEGIQQLNGGNVAGAVVLLKSALEKDQNFADARYQLAKAYVAAGKFEQAVKEYEKVLRQTPKKSGLKLELAGLYNLVRKPDEAMRVAQEYMKSDRDAPEALEIIGTSKALKKQFKEAEDYLLKAIQLAPERASARLALAEIYLLSGEAGEARLLLDQVIRADQGNVKAYYLAAELESSSGNKDKSLEIYQKIASIDPNQAFALYKAGLIHIERRELLQAEAIAQDLIKKFPQRGEGNRLKGITSFYNKNYPEAIAALQDSLKTQPTLEAYYYLGLSFYSRGDAENALSQFQRILDYEPTFTKARVLAAMILLNKKRLDDAITEAKRVLERDGKNALAHNIIGSAYMAKGNYDEGMQQLTLATSLDPTIVDAHLKKGVYKLSQGNAKEAEIDLKEAVRVAPDKSNGRLLLYAHYMRSESFAKALQIMKEGINGTPTDAIYYNNMAAAQFGQKKIEGALESLAKAKESNPAYLPSYFNSAAFYAAKGDFDKALTEYSEILQKEPQNLKALLSAAALHEMKGNDRDALALLTNAKGTKHAAGYLALARFHLRKKSHEEAINIIDEAAKTIPEKQPALLELKGEILISTTRFDDALKAFDDLDRVKPGGGISGKVLTYLMMKQTNKAAEEAKRAISLRPQSPDGYLLLASVYESQGNVNAAAAEVKNSLNVSPRNILARIKLGNLNAAMKDHAGAATAYRDALAQDPAAVPALYAMGVLSEETGKRQEAVTYYKKALSHDPSHVPSLNNLANLYLSGSGAKENALRFASMAYQKEPESPSILDTFGYALLTNGKTKEARQVLTKAASLLPENQTVQYHFAMACKACGDKKEAIAILQKALQKQSSFPERNHAKLLMTELTSGRSRKNGKK